MCKTTAAQCAAQCGQGTVMQRQGEVLLSKAAAKYCYIMAKLRCARSWHSLVKFCIGEVSYAVQRYSYVKRDCVGYHKAIARLCCECIGIVGLSKARQLRSKALPGVGAEMF